MGSWSFYFRALFSAWDLEFFSELFSESYDNAFADLPPSLHKAHIRGEGFPRIYKATHCCPENDHPTLETMHITKPLLLGLAALTDLAIAALSSGCNSAPTITSGITTISVGGTQRQFTIRVPRDYQNNKGYKLMYGLHWVGGRMD
jgi:hypothetical protein